VVPLQPVTQVLSADRASAPEPPPRYTHARYHRGMMVPRPLNAAAPGDAGASATIPCATGLAGASPRSKIWVERDGEVVLSEWRVALLEAIEETGSLTAAAERLDVPYRTAWQKLREIEARLGTKLLETQSGGSEGGGSCLTAEARELIARFHRVTAGVAELVEQRFRAAFADLLR
jgi:molybdate transport system regulatory protein